MNINEYREDLTKHEKGSPCYFSEHEESSYIDVKRVGTPQYSKEIEEIKKSLYSFNEQDMDSDLILAHWLVGYGVTGWGGIFDGDKELKYSKATSRKIFLNPEYFRTVNQLLIQHAQSYQNYLHDAANDDAEAIKKK